MNPITGLDEYQNETDKTANGLDYGMPPLVYAAGSMAGEAGETFNKVKKVFRDDGGTLTSERREQIKKELGGTLWYLAQSARQAGLKLSEVANANIQEIQGRIERGTLFGDGDNR